MAQAAHGRIDGHEALCTERWTQSASALTRIEHGVAGLYRRWWQLAAAVIVLLLGMVGTALYVGGKIAQLSGGQWP